MKIPPSVLSYIPLRHYYAIKRPLSLKQTKFERFDHRLIIIETTDVDLSLNHLEKNTNLAEKLHRETRAIYEHREIEKEFSTSSTDLAEKNLSISRNNSWYSICDGDKRPNSRSSTRRTAKRLTATRNTCLSKQTKTRLSSSITIIQIDLNSLNRLCLNHLLQT